MKIDKKLISQAEEIQIYSIRQRLDNWARCFRDRPKRMISITAVAIRALQEALYDPKKDPNTKKFREVPADEVWIDEPDFKDAELIEKVWAGMGHGEERDLRIPNTGITIGTAKILIFLYAFASEQNYRNWLGKNGVNSRYRDSTVNSALLYFYYRVKVAESMNNPSICKNT